MDINIFISCIFISWILLIYVPKTGIYDVEYLFDIPIIELVYIVLWIISDEILFFIGHKLLHNPILYRIHKVHHKFKITNCWTTFYSNPLDNLFVMVAAIILPVIMMRYNYNFSAPSLSIYLHIAVTTFISSHHTTFTNKIIKNTPHLLHHKLFNINYGNLWFLDYVSGSSKNQNNYLTL